MNQIDTKPRIRRKAEVTPPHCIAAPKNAPKCYGDPQARILNPDCTCCAVRDPKAGTVKMLGPDECRARVEVTLLGGEVERAGFGEVGDLIGFSFGALRKPYFPFWLPAVPGGIKRDGSDPSMREQRLGRLLQGVFAKSGVYGVDLYEAASEIERAERHKIRRTIGKGMKPAPRIHAGEWGHLLAWGKMTHRTRRAFDLLSERWSRAALEKMLPPEIRAEAA